MSKGIIVIDIPERCADCPVEAYSETFYGDETSHWCLFEYKGYTDGVRENRRAGWCPIKPMPERFHIDGDRTMEIYADGRNELIDEMFGRKG